MIPIKPCKSLLLCAFAIFSLGIFAVFLTGLPLGVKLILMLLLSIYSFYEILKLLQYMPYSLHALSVPTNNAVSWQLQLKNGQSAEAKLLHSTRITSKIIILHFRLLHRRICVYQIIFPAMLGCKNYHDLLVYLKTN